MIIAGAGGHAKEIFTELKWLGHSGPLFFFDGMAAESTSLFDIPVICNRAAAQDALATDNRFVIAVGKPALREKLYTQFIQWGGNSWSLISAHALIGDRDIVLGHGLNIMAGALITASVSIGTGSLINARASVHHDCRIGNFCELSPGCRLLGKASIGNYTSVGSNAVLLPGVSVGDYVRIGAGAVVTKDIPDGAVVKGIPGRY